MAATTRISQDAQERLKELQLALQKEFGQKATTEEIASALICGTPVPQLSGMLIAYNKNEAVSGKA